MSKDLIRRSDAIKALDANFTIKGKENMQTVLNYLELVRTRIESAPTIEPKRGEWIPCSERLPTKAGHYLCSFNKPNRIDNIYVDLAYWTGGRWYGYLTNEINAWMPLPKPWEGADDES